MEVSRLEPWSCGSGGLRPRLGQSCSSENLLLFDCIYAVQSVVDAREYSGQPQSMAMMAVRSGGF